MPIILQEINIDCQAFSFQGGIWRTVAQRQGSLTADRTQKAKEAKMTRTIKIRNLLYLGAYLSLIHSKSTSLNNRQWVGMILKNKLSLCPTIFLTPQDQYSVRKQSCFCHSGFDIEICGVFVQFKRTKPHKP
jgi:hypothetical protein